MKKTIRNIFILLAMVVLLVTLAGCNNDEKSDKKKDNDKEIVATKDDNKLVGTKSGEEEFFGKFEETIEITFEDNKANSIVMTRELEDEETVETVKGVLPYLNDEEGMKFEVKDNKVIITFDPQAYAEEEGLSVDELTKEAFEKELKDNGYTIK